MALGWGIVGIGSHPDLKVAPAMQVANGSELVAVCGRDQGRSDAFAEAHGAKAAYTDLNDLLRDSRVDAVFVASPNSLHAPQSIQSANAGKHVLSEKPMAITVEDAVAMVRACRRKGVKLGIGFELRFHPAHLFARELVFQGAIGRIRLAQGQWARGERGATEHLPRTGLREWWEQPELVGDASVMMGMGVHVFDLMRFMLAEDAVEVVAMTDGQTARQPLEHIASISLRMSGGTIASVLCGRLLPDTQNDFAIYGSDGRITGNETIWEGRFGKAEVVSAAVNRTETFQYDYLANFVDELEDFSDAVERDRDPRATGLDGLFATLTTAAAVESARTGHAVKVVPVDV